MTPTASSRVYLAVPFAEKDEAKRHGARWNPERRQWWIDRQDIAMHPGVSRWFVDDDAVAGVHDLAAGRERPDSVMSAPVFNPATTFDLPACACSTPPWEHCEHTTTAQSSGGVG